MDKRYKIFLEECFGVSKNKFIGELDFYLGDIIEEVKEYVQKKSIKCGSLDQVRDKIIKQFEIEYDTMFESFKVILWEMTTDEEIDDLIELNKKHPDIFKRLSAGLSQITEKTFSMADKTANKVIDDVVGPEFFNE